MLLGRGKKHTIKSDQGILFHSTGVHGVLDKSLVTEREPSVGQLLPVLQESCGDAHDEVIVWVYVVENGFLSKARDS